jgi:hypothetical protein
MVSRFIPGGSTGERGQSTGGSFGSEIESRLARCLCATTRPAERPNLKKANRLSILQSGIRRVNGGHRNENRRSDQRLNAWQRHHARYVGPYPSLELERRGNAQRFCLSRTARKDQAAGRGNSEVAVVDRRVGVEEPASSERQTRSWSVRMQLDRKSRFTLEQSSAAWVASFPQRLKAAFIPK